MINFRTFAARSLGGASALALCLAAPALAQTTGAPADATVDTGVEEIVVTAERRAESVQDVAVAVTALSGDALLERGINSAGDLQFVTPGLSFARSTSTQGVSTLRGVGAVNISVGGDPGVAFYVDNHYVQNSAYVSQDFFDVERVEVLRGPQGSLYGRNAIGGAINVITARPKKAFDARVGAQFTNYEGRRFDGMVNVPLGDMAALRLAGVKDDRDGFVRNLTNGERLDESHYYTVRGSLLAEPSDRLELLLRGYVYNNKPDVPVLVTNPYPTTPTLAGFVPNPYLAPGVGTNPTVENRRVTRNDLPTNTEDDAKGASLDVTYDIGGDFSLKSLSAYNRSRNDADQDTDGSDVVFSDQSIRLRYETLSQEFNLNYNNGDWAGVAGLFFYDERSRVSFNIDTFNFFGMPRPAVSTINLAGRLRAKSYAAFAQVDGPVAGPLEFTLGGRYSRDKKHSLENVRFPDLGVLVADFRQRDSWDSFTGKAGLRYHVDEDVMTYLTFANGYKSGGFNIGGTQPSYKPEKVDSIEAGLKSTLLDNTLRLNVAAFYNKYRDKQENKIETVQAVLVNAASARVYGFEVEAQARPVDALTIDATLSYLNAKYRDFVTADPADPAAGQQQLKGNHLTYSPRWKATVGAQYEFDLGASGTVTLRGDLSFIDEQFVRPFNLPGDRLPAYFKGNALIGWRDASDRYSVEAFVNNIGNIDVVESKLLTAAILGPNYNSLVQAPRVYGVRFAIDF